jgi:hypothetical protein
MVSSLSCYSFRTMLQIMNRPKEKGKILNNESHQIQLSYVIFILYLLKISKIGIILILLLIFTI